MANRTQDWRETEQHLRGLPDHELRQALADAGVRAVLPSDRKPRGSIKTPGEMGDNTSRWAKGEWQERISLDGLPDAQKFLENPEKPPTQAVAHGTALSHPAPEHRPWGAAALGLVITACLLGTLVYALRDDALFDRPRVGAKPPAASVVTTAAAAAPEAKNAVPRVPAPAAAAEGAAAPAAADDAKPDAAAALSEGPARPAGTPAAAAARDPEAEAVETRRLRFLENQAREGDVASMIQVARMLVDRGEAEQAMKWAGRAKLKSRSSIEARIVLGDAQMLAGYGKAAEETWQGALHRSPRNEELKRRLGEL